jgi:salicylate hydroxylase
LRNHFNHFNLLTSINLTASLLAMEGNSELGTLLCLEEEIDYQPLAITIVGGGISGLSAAIALRRNGHRVTVHLPGGVQVLNPLTNTRIQIIDKYNIIGDEGAAIHLCPNVTRILPRWGIKTENLNPSLMSRYVERTKGGDIIKEIDLAASNARWGYPRHMVHRSTLQRELMRVAMAKEGLGEPVKLLQRKRAVDVNPDVGVKLDNDVLVKGQVIIGADGIAVGSVCLNVLSTSVYQPGLTLLRSQRRERPSRKCR